MDFNLSKHTIFLTLHGSHAYGMAHPESDVDLRGIAIPPARYFHGYLKRFEQSEESLPHDIGIGDTTLINKIQGIIGRIVPADEKTDSVIYDIRKLIFLAVQANANIFDILWADESCHIIRKPLADLLLENRDLFLSTKVRWAYSGYSVSQLKRICLHKQYLLHPPTHKPTRGEHGLPEHTVMPRDQLMAAESLITRKIEEWLGSKEDLPKETLLEIRQRTVLAIRDIWSALETDRLPSLLPPPITKDDELDDQKVYRAAGKLLGYESNFLDLLDKERGYRSMLNQWNQYQNWKQNRNEERAAMEAKFGYDGKHASHLVRLMRQCREILTSGKVIVKRPDAEELLAIRNGAWTYEQLVEWAKKQDEELGVFYDSGQSPLPREPDHNKIDTLCQKIVERALGYGDG